MELKACLHSDLGARNALPWVMVDGQMILVFKRFQIGNATNRGLWTMCGQRRLV